MDFKIVILEKATAETRTAYKWYEEQLIGLGEEFLLAIEHHKNLIHRNPKLFAITHKNHREVLLKRFPFVIVYSVNDIKKEIVIIAIFHCKRNPKTKFKIK